MRFKAPRGSASGLLLAALALAAWLAIAVPASGAGRTSIVTQTTEPGVVELEENPAISADGTTIAYVRDHLGAALFLKRLGHPATPVDVPPGEETETGEGGEGFEAGSPSLSADGRLLAFASEDPELSSEDTDYDNSAAGKFLVRHIFVYDARTGKTQLVSRNTGSHGSAAKRDSNLPSISADGRYVAFTSQGPNLQPREIDGVYVRDLRRQTTILASPESGRLGKPTEGFHPSLSANGALLAYLVPSRPRGRLEVAVRNLRSGRTTVVSPRRRPSRRARGRRLLRNRNLGQRPLRRLRQQGHESRPAPHRRPSRRLRHRPAERPHRPRVEGEPRRRRRRQRRLDRPLDQRRRPPGRLRNPGDQSRASAATIATPTSSSATSGTNATRSSPPASAAAPPIRRWRATPAR